MAKLVQFSGICKTNCMILVKCSNLEKQLPYFVNIKSLLTSYYKFSVQCNAVFSLVDLQLAES